MKRLFTNRVLIGAEGVNIPLPAGKYKIRIDTYEVDRDPRVGEDGTAYTNYAKQCGELIKSTFETMVVE